jgi:hypothetical protein
MMRLTATVVKQNNVETVDALHVIVAVTAELVKKIFSY